LRNEFDFSSVLFARLLPPNSFQNDLWYEKKLQREEEAEKKIYGETEKFVTPAYKKHLEELR
jgi:hypothetical protein